MNNNKNRNIFILSVFIILIFVLINYTQFGKTDIAPYKSRIKDIISPLQGLSTNIGQQLRKLVSFPVGLTTIYKENQAMKKKITELEGVSKNYQELISENDRFRTLLNFKDSVAPLMGYELTAASVISRDISNWFGIITLNRGASDGIAVNMIIINDQGLIGRIISVSHKTSEVLLITDPRSGVAALVQESRAPGMIEGVASAQGKLKMVHIPLGSELNIGQTVVSSSFGSLFPKGIPIGRIADVEHDPSGLFISASVNSFVNIDKLEEVMIITGMNLVKKDAQISELPFPWGQGDISPKKGGRSPGALTMLEQKGAPL
ncbi:MAG: rod shape-determining protein MreC [Peptococcaceae bacterium]|nr:rod shape-determining protein MreC [Peptococcaceae bacterium]